MGNFTYRDILDAHNFSLNNKESLKKDSLCGCFYCLSIFNPSEITCWLRENALTAFCPYCSVDSIIGESSGCPITEDFLIAMSDYWFS